MDDVNIYCIPHPGLLHLVSGLRELTAPPIRLEAECALVPSAVGETLKRSLPLQDGLNFIVIPELPGSEVEEAWALQVLATAEAPRRCIPFALPPNTTL